MGHIKEPAGVDLLVKSRLLTKEEEIGISEYIRKYKAKNNQKHLPTKSKVRTKKIIV